jgi:ubiquinone/menaquinone biosynthesis C-methylase UbiE
MTRVAASAPARIIATTLLLTLAACATNERPKPPAAPTTASTATPAHAHDGGHDEGRATCGERFDDVEKWQRIFDAPARAEWQKPTELLAALEIRPGMRVADVGAGTGFFLRYLSAAVGKSGEVVAVEVETNLVSHMKNRAKDEHLSNVTVVLTPLDRLVLPDRSLDVMMIVDAFHHIDRRVDYFRAAAATLAPKGRVAIVDWKPGKQPRGPRDETHQVAPEAVEREMASAGYRLVDAPDILPYQFVLVFDRPDGTIPPR